MSLFFVSFLLVLMLTQRNNDDCCCSLLLHCICEREWARASNIQSTIQSNPPPPPIYLHNISFQCYNSIFYLCTFLNDEMMWVWGLKGKNAPSTRQYYFSVWNSSNSLRYVTEIRLMLLAGLESSERADCDCVTVKNTQGYETHNSQL